MEEVDPENQLRGRHEEADHPPPADGGGIAARATIAPSTSARIECCPHAVLALAMASTDGATWGSGSQALSISGGSTTELPEDEDQQIDECSSEWSDFGEYTIGPEPAPDQSGEQPPLAPPEEQQPTADEWALVEEEAEPVAPRPRRRRRRPRRDPLGMARFACKVLLPALCAMAGAVDSDHLEDLDEETLQQLAGPEASKSVVAPSVIRQAVGKDLDAWILAASVEHDSFLEKGGRGGSHGCRHQSLW